MDITFHQNPTQPHQVEHGKWLERGLKAHGLTLNITQDPFKEADIHIVSGPHYAKRFWLNHPRTILIDRAYLPEHQVKTRWASEDWVSIGWMREDGGRHFRSGLRREPIKRKAQRTGKRTVFLADYDGPIEQADTVRLHPSRGEHTESLHSVLSRHDVAIGYSTSALVAAGLEGLRVICKDPANIMYEPNWLDLLPYADWHYSEMDKLWENLLS